MTNANRPTDSRTAERRSNEPEAPLFGELLRDAGFVTDVPEQSAHEGWLRKHGVAPDRRVSKDRRSR